MDFLQGAEEFAAQLVETRGQRLDSADQDIIGSGLGPGAGARGVKTDDFAQAAADAVADDGISGLFRDRESESRGRTTLALSAAAGLQHEAALMLAAPLGGGEKLDAFLQPLRPQQRNRVAFDRSRRAARFDFAVAGTGHGAKPRRKSGGEALAAANAASVEHLAAADGGHTGAKTMATLAHDLGGLIGPLHGELRLSEAPDSADAEVFKVSRFAGSCLRHAQAWPAMRMQTPVDVGAKPKSRAAL